MSVHSPITLNEIFVYPVKSLAGFSVQRWPITPQGLKYDRQWMLIDADGVFLSQRRLPRMSLIHTGMDDRHLSLSAPGFPPLSLPIGATEGKALICEIWRDRCPAYPVSAQADEWFSDFLGTDCRLVYQTDDAIRPVDPDYSRPGDRIYFSDGFPFLLISENSLAALNEAMNLNYPMTRFRPNLVVAGCTAYAEDGWRSIRIGEIDFRLPKPCARCSVPSIDPETGVIGKEPLLTLSRLRKWKNKPYFGQNALHDNTGFLQVGDWVTVAATGPRQPPLD